MIHITAQSNIFSCDITLQEKPAFRFLKDLEKNWRSWHDNPQRFPHSSTTKVMNKETGRLQTVRGVKNYPDYLKVTTEIV